MEHIDLWIAFISGLFSFLSPCVLPIVPGYISFISGTNIGEIENRGDHRKIVVSSGVRSIFFVLGFSLVFMLLGASATSAGKFLESYRTIFSRIAGAIIIIFGLHLIGVLKLNFLYYQKKLEVKSASPGIFTAFVAGLAFAFGWSPCIGPILAGILTLAAQQKTLIKGMVLLGAYSLGVGIPFIISGFLIGYFMRFFNRYKRFIRTGEVLAGIILVLIGVLIFSNNLSVLVRFLPSGLYNLAK